LRRAAASAGGLAALLARLRRDAAAAQRRAARGLPLSCAAACIRALVRRQTRTCLRRSRRCLACPECALALLARSERLAPPVRLAWLGVRHRRARARSPWRGRRRRRLQPGIALRPERMGGAALLAPAAAQPRQRQAASARMGGMAPMEPAAARPGRRMMAFARTAGTSARMPGLQVLRRRAWLRHQRQEQRPPARRSLRRRKHRLRHRWTQDDCAGAIAALRPSPPGTRRCDGHS